MSLSYFDRTSVGDGTYATSTIDTSALVTAIQGVGSDTYFDETAEIGKVYVYYDHQDGRQQKRLIHERDNSFSVQVKWSTFARDGTWEKTKVRAYDRDGATNELLRATIGSGEDLTHANNVMTLNDS